MDKKYKCFKRSRLHVDYINYRKSRNQVQNLIKRKKRNYIKEKLTENIGNSKELWRTLNKIRTPI